MVLLGRTRKDMPASGPDTTVRWRLGICALRGSWKNFAKPDLRSSATNKEPFVAGTIQDIATENIKPMVFRSSGMDSSVSPRPVELQTAFQQKSWSNSVNRNPVCLSQASCNTAYESNVDTYRLANHERGVGGDVANRRINSRTGGLTRTTLVASACGRQNLMVLA